MKVCYILSLYEPIVTNYKQKCLTTASRTDLSRDADVTVIGWFKAG